MKWVNYGSFHLTNSDLYRIPSGWTERWGRYSILRRTLSSSIHPGDRIAYPRDKESLSLQERVG